MEALEYGPNEDALLMQPHRQIHLSRQTAYRNNEGQFRGLEEVDVGHLPAPKRTKYCHRIWQ
jgi:hypothetical protein